MLRVFVSLLLLISICNRCNAQQPVAFYKQPNLTKPINIAAYVLFYDDTSGDTLAFAQIKKQNFIPFTTALMQVNAAKRPVIVNWLKFKIQNNSVSDTLKVIFLCNTQVVVQLYSDDQPNSKPFSFEQINADPIGMMLVIPPVKTNSYYVRIVDFVRKLQPLNAELYTPGSYLQNYRDKNDNQSFLLIVMCTALGCLFFIGICAGYSLLLIGDRALACYTLYVFIAFFAWLITINTRFNLRLFGSPRWGPDFPYISAAIFFYALFIVYILDIPKTSPKKWRIIKVLLVLNLIEILLEIIEHQLGRFIFSSNIFYLYIINIPIASINLYLIYTLITNKSRLRKYLLAGLINLFFLVIVMNNVGYYISIRAKSPSVKMFTSFPPLWAMLGVVAETTCFAFALIYRSKLLYEEKNQLQVGYTAQLQHELHQRTLAFQEQSKLLEKQKLRQMEITFEKKIAETEMIALRAQMNPHFIFNCLNSIKLYTLENDSETASTYLTTFSRLIRLVLENSQSERVTIANELETLRLYIELEIMRFKHKVNYSIKVDDNVDTSYIEVPPLLLQPYVENAIWHGLMHKELGGTVIVAISQPGEHLLTVAITDDGVGREAANEYKSRSITKHKSFGLKMTAERIEIINQLYDTHTEIAIEDLRDTDGKSSGTRVIIHIPI